MKISTKHPNKSLHGIEVEYVHSNIGLKVREKTKQEGKRHPREWWIEEHELDKN